MQLPRRDASHRPRSSTRAKKAVALSNFVQSAVSGLAQIVFSNAETMTEPTGRGLI
jgi:hypothetical protein